MFVNNTLVRDALSCLTKTVRKLVFSKARFKTEGKNSYPSKSVCDTAFALVGCDN